MRKRGFHNIEAFDCLPKGRYGLVLHWLYSAWIGNYGNAQRGNEDREALLSTFLTQYADHVVGGGLMLLALVDAISDLREPRIAIYPVRHTAEQVAECAATFRFAVERKMFKSNCGRLPRMLQVLRKSRLDE